MKYSLAVIVALAVILMLGGCSATLDKVLQDKNKPEYDTVTNFTPDCKNQQAQIRYLEKLHKFDSKDVSNKKYNRTMEIQIERLKFYCAQNEN